MVRLVLPLAAAALIAAAAGCGGGSDDEPLPQVISKTTASPSPTPTPAATAPPAPATSAPAPRVTAAPPPTDTPTPVPNKNPSFPQTQFQGVQTTYVKDSKDKIVDAVTTLIAPAATDPDGDQLTYSWTVTTGTITNAGLTGTWVRAIAHGEEAPGKVTVTASDGRGGTASFVADFQ